MNFITPKNNLIKLEELFLNYFDLKDEYLKKSKPAGNIGIGKLENLKGIYAPSNFHGVYSYEGIYNRFLNNFTFDILRQIADKVIVIGAIINTRCSQIRPFGLPAQNQDDIGFMVKLRDPKKSPDKKNKRDIAEITEFLLHTGFLDLKENDDEILDRDCLLQDVNEMLTRDVLTYDQIAIVPRYTIKGELAEFRVIDGTTIKRVNPEIGFEGDKKIRYVQELDGRIVETFTKDEIIFDYMNRRSGININLYGLSPIEQAVDFITSFLFAVNYNQEFFNSSSQPKGIITFEGAEYDRETLEELRREWVSMFSGVKGLWRTPFLQQNAKWQSIAPSNRDMEFNQYFQVLAGWICSVFKIDPTEMGQRLAQATQVLSENNEAKIAYSKSRGLYDIASFLEKIYYKLLNLNSRWSEYKVVFTGLEPRDKEGENRIMQIRLQNFKTINEERAEQDMEPDPYGDIILNPTYLQYRQSKEMQEQQKQMGSQEIEGNDEDFEVEEENENNELMTEFNKMLKSKENEIIELEIKI
ncbi:MAG: phage portal protein [Endomicrobiia bacterium]